MRIRRLTDERELVRLFAFRYKVFVEELGWMARRERGAHILVDEFDRESANYAAYDDDGEIIGSVRVVADGPLGLPLERCRVLNGYRVRPRRIYELSRLAVAPTWRCTLLAALLMKAGYQCAVDQGATHIVLDTYVGNGYRYDRLYGKLGFDQLTEAYADPDYLWQQEVATFSLDCARAHKTWPKVRPSLYSFFTSDDERIDHGLRAGPRGALGGAVARARRAAR